MGSPCWEIEAAVALREAGFRQPILLLEGFFEPVDVPVCAEYGLTVAVHRIEQLHMIQAAALPVRMPIYIKLNTGMNRLGFTQAIQHCGRSWHEIRPSVRWR